MPTRAPLTPPKKALDLYQQSIAEFRRLGQRHETAVRSAFQILLDDCARQCGLKLVPEYPVIRQGRRPLRADGALVDQFNLSHGLWEAKDSADDLEKEIKAKFALGYPQRNILFQSPDRAVLYQNGKRVLDSGLARPEQITDILRAFRSVAGDLRQIRRQGAGAGRALSNHGRAGKIPPLRGDRVRDIRAGRRLLHLARIPSGAAFRRNGAAEVETFIVEGGDATPR